MRCKKKLCSSFTTTKKEDFNPIMFFKIYIPDRSSQQLQLPSTFVKKLNYIVPPKSIRMRFGYKTWSVDVEEIGDTLVLQKGWSDFVNDSSLEPGDFLLFSYLGAAKFNVKILGQSGVERINLCALQQCKIEREDFQIVPHDQFQLTNRHAEEMNILAESDQFHDRCDMTNQLREKMNILADDEHLRDQYEQTDKNGDEVNKFADDEQLHDQQYEQANQHDEEMNKSEDEEHSASEDSDYHYESEGVSEENHYRDKSEGVFDENEKQKSKKKSDENEKQKSRKKKSTDDKSKSTADKKRPRVRGKPKHRIWNGDGPKNRVPNVSFESDYPHFKMGVLPVYRCRAQLNVPMPFARKYMKPGTMRTTLQTLNNSWPITLTTYPNGCCKISSGWLAFVRDNCIKVGDICVFELIDLNLSTFKVSIFPMHP